MSEDREPPDEGAQVEHEAQEAQTLDVHVVHAAVRREGEFEWSVVLAANLTGTAAFAWAAARTAIFEPGTRATFAALGMESLEAGFGPTLLRGILGGWLIALMVWLLPASDRNRVAVITAVTFVVGLGRFSHCIAGSVDTLFAVWSGQATLGKYLLDFLLPAVVGNSLGGVALVAGLNHAQAQGELPA